MNPALRRLAASFYMAPPDCPLDRFAGMLAERGLGGVGLTARALQAMSAEALARLLRKEGLVATSLNSTGYVLHAEAAAAGAQATLDDLLFAAAAALDAPINVILGGTLHAAGAGAAPSLRDARARAAEGLARLAHRARGLGARLALEPMHPNGLGTKGCINQLSQARALIAPFPEVGLTVDFYHSFWDADLAPTLAKATRLLEVVQICGVVIPADGGAPRRAELAEGPADLPEFLAALRQAGYRGMLEYEIFHEQMGGAPLDGLLDRAAADFLAVSPAGTPAG